MSTFKKEKAPLKPTRKARNELTEEQKQEIKEAFDLFDTDGVGNRPSTQDTSTPRSSRWRCVRWGSSPRRRR
jgi:Ca2+-binding EF-hand superfamily protein